MNEPIDEPRKPLGFFGMLGATIVTVVTVLGGIAILIAAAVSLHYMVGMLYLSWMFAY